MLVVRELRKYLLPVALAVVAVTGFAYVSSSTVRSHLQTRAGDVETVRDRQAIDGAALNMLTHRPLFGFGWGRFQAVEFNYVQPSDGYSLWNRKPIPVHNVYLSIATDLGLVGASMWLLILLFGIGGAVVGRRGPPELRAWRILLGTLSVMWLVAGLSSPLSSSFQSLIIWLLAALVVGGANAYEPRAEPPAGLPDGAGGRNRLRHELPFRYRADAVG